MAEMEDEEEIAFMVVVGMEEMEGTVSLEKGETEAMEETASSGPGEMVAMEGMVLVVEEKEELVVAGPRGMD
jgi:hypothetical protein